MLKEKGWDEIESCLTEGEEEQEELYNAWELGKRSVEKERALRKKTKK